MAPHPQLSFSSHLLFQHLLFFLATSYADILKSSQIFSTSSTTLVSFTGGAGNYPFMAREFLSAHNTVRAEFKEQALVWDRQLARFAKRWSDRMSTECRMRHSMGPYGENMFWGLGWSWRASDAVRAWASEQAFYNLIDNSCAAGRMCGHYTQIIWNTTLRLGCGRSECYNGGVIITCNYDPPGNYVGERPLATTDP